MDQDLESLEGKEPPFTSHQSVWLTSTMDVIRSFSYRQNVFFLCMGIAFMLINAAYFRFASILDRQKPAEKSPRPKTSSKHPTHLLVVLGSGGHTAEMLNILQQTPLLQVEYTHRTYVVSSGDSFSASKAVEFEKELLEQLERESIQGSNKEYDIVTVRRARRVHQGIMTAPFSTLACLFDCFKVLRGTHPQLRIKHGQYPDLILTNGPGTGVCVVLASIILLFFGLASPHSKNAKDMSYHSSGQMRTIYIESWARVESLSLSGKILKPFVDRFIVQWPQLVKKGDRVEYIGPLVT